MISDISIFFGNFTILIIIIGIIFLLNTWIQAYFALEITKIEYKNIKDKKGYE